MGLALPFVHLLVPGGSALERAVRWRAHPSAGLGAQALVAGIGENLHRRSVGQELDQPQSAGVGDVGTASGPGRAAEQQPAVAVRDDHGLDRLLLGPSGDERVPVLTSGGRPPDPGPGVVGDSGLPAGTEVVDDLGQGPQPHAGADGAAALGAQGPHLVDGPGDGGAVRTEAAGRHVMGGRVPKMRERRQEPVDEHQPVLRTRAHSSLPRPGRTSGPVPLMPRRTRLGHELSDHIGRQPVILRSPMIAARDTFRTTRP
ncbi:hypothetical protein M2169_006305 [Streptomyces sp. MJP52]|nr:hypothetical protein [Streptomyces sp. MJP52]